MNVITEPGWYENVSIDDYRRIPAMSASGIEDFRRSPAHFKHAQDNPKEPTEAMTKGTALHLAILEPHLFAGRYQVLGPCEAELKSGKRKGEACGSTSKVIRAGELFCGTHDPTPDEPVPPNLISEAAMEEVLGMRDAVLANPDTAKYFRGRGCCELTGVAVDPETGVLLKIRLDRKLDRADWIHVDLKSTADASREAFIRQAGRMGYVRRAAFYRHVLQILEMPARASVLVAVEAPKPHGCQPFLLDEKNLEAWGEEIGKHLAQYAHCLETDTWPAYEPGMRHLELKPWDLPAPKPYADEWDEAGNEAREEVFV